MSLTSNDPQLITRTRTQVWHQLCGGDKHFATCMSYKIGNNARSNPHLVDFYKVCEGVVQCTELLC